MFGILVFLLTFTAIAESITLTWDRSASTNITGYVLHYAIKGDVYTNTITVNPNISVSTISNLRAGQTYLFFVTVVDTNNNIESDPSNIITDTPPATVQVKLWNFNVTNTVLIARDVWITNVINRVVWITNQVVTTNVSPPVVNVTNAVPKLTLIVTSTKSTNTIGLKWNTTQAWAGFIVSYGKVGGAVYTYSVESTNQVVIRDLSSNKHFFYVTPYDAKYKRGPVSAIITNTPGTSKITQKTQ